MVNVNFTARERHEMLMKYGHVHKFTIRRGRKLVKNRVGVGRRMATIWGCWMCRVEYAEF